MILYFVLLGAFAGLVAGLLGIGGGLIIVPVLVAIFQHQNIATPAIVHLAIGTSLASIVFTSLASIWAHHRQGGVLWPIFRQLTPGIVVGAWLGANIANFLPTDTLQHVFGWFELYVAIQMTLNIKPKPQRKFPGGRGAFGVGNIIGTVSALVGIGGGTLTVPFLTWCNIAMRNCVATSAACGLPIAIAGALGFIATGWDKPHLPNSSLGYIYLPALLGIVSASVLFAPRGAKLAHKLPAAHLKKIFAVLLYILAARMLLF